MNKPPESDKSTLTKSAADSWRKLSLFVLAAIAVTLAYPSFITYVYDLNSPEQRSEFGDQFGGLNALTSALAFGALIYTIILQRRDLANQREDLELQREDMRASREELSKQAQAQREYVEATLLAAQISGTGQALASRLQAISLQRQQQLTNTGTDEGRLYQQLNELLMDARNRFSTTLGSQSPESM